MQLPYLLHLLLGFAIVAISANQLARYMRLIKLPVITGLLITGIISGPFFIGLIPEDARDNLYFVNEISLAIIAFAASSELYLKELRSSAKTIKWMTFGQLGVTFVFSSLAVFFLESYIPFMKGMSVNERIAVAILAGTIFVARSPASAIAIINEVRAKGPFTQMAIGVTVIKDFLVIVLFSVCFSIATALTRDVGLSFDFILVLGVELIASVLLALLLFLLLRLILKARIHQYAKRVYIIAAGYSVYFISNTLKASSGIAFGKELHVEPLLVCILGSFLITNYSRYRHEFNRIIQDIGPFIFTAFFTLIGATMSIEILLQVWQVAFIFFILRIISIIIGSYVGGAMGSENRKFMFYGWMPFVTQAGVGLGLATAVAKGFPGWGDTFASLIIAVVVLNQIFGPPFFKYALSAMGESRSKAQFHGFDGVRDAIIFGVDNQSVALARQLTEHGWEVRIAAYNQDINEEDFPGLQIEKISEISLTELERLGANNAEAIVTLLTDDENYQICELAYEKIGTKDLVVRLNHRFNQSKFHKLGCLVVDPSTAIVSLLDHMVRSPQAASLMLGMEEGQDTLDLQITNPNMQGLPLRDLKLPPDIIILSIRRRGQLIITHGYTRLRLGDNITMLGSRESLEAMTLRLEK